LTRAYVGLGSNLGDREAMLRRALELLGTRSGVRVLRVSSFRETAPVGLTEQPDFVNAAAEIETTLGARDVLGVLLGVERELGRERVGPRFGPRTIDLDLLLYGDAIVDEPGLTIPHSRLHERRFVLEPLAELNPALEVPGRGSVATLLAGL
jgi:2-amino-4-hydroxy-6-hydroxymethyldihydropteridine diphosphokinase